MVDADQYMPTREDLEHSLRNLGFRPTTSDRDLWLYPDGTKSVLFTDKGDHAGEALYCDAEQHEPGKYINYRQIHAAASGILALDAPELAKIPLLGPPVWASGPTPPEAKLLPAKAPDHVEGVIEAEFEPEPAPDTERAVATPEPPPTDAVETHKGRWRTALLASAFVVTVGLLGAVVTYFVIELFVR
jgi:hypothetical protein